MKLVLIILLIIKALVEENKIENALSLMDELISEIKKNDLPLGSCHNWQLPFP